MANQIIVAQPRVTDVNGDPASGAKAYFYQTGTTTPVTVYSDTALSVAHASPLVADSGGILAQIFHSGATDVKVVVTDADDVNLFTLDPAPSISGASSAAEDVTFSPVAGNSATQVQQAIENNLSAINTKVPTTRTITTGNGLTGGGDLSTNRTFAVDGSSDIDADTGSTSKFPHVSAVEGFVNGKRFTSSAQTITSGGLVTIAHGLGATPGIVVFRLKCTTTDGGYAVNDEIIVNANNGSSSTNDRYSTPRVDATNVYVRFSNDSFAFAAANKSTGAIAGLTNSSWQLYVEVYL